jgi:hypothetical protein
MANEHYFVIKMGGRYLRWWDDTVPFYPIVGQQLVHAQKFPTLEAARAIAAQVQKGMSELPKRQQKAVRVIEVTLKEYL